MKTMSNSFARSYTLTRRLGTKVQLAGKMMYLPNSRVPRVVQKLTLSQVAAIPRDRYSVKVIESTQTSKVTFANRYRRMLLSARRERLRFHGRFERAARASDFIVPKAQIVPETISANADSTKKYTTVIELLDLAKKEIKVLYHENRELRRIQKDAPPGYSGIFFPPVDEGKMSDCILKVVERYFGSEDTGEIRDKKYKLPQFCVLMYYYFRRINILQNTSRQPFCLYLLKKVFENESKFTSRTFNNYATAPEFAEVEKDFTYASRLNINFKYHPLPSENPLQDAFHEIGWAFHNSSYFEELRELQKNTRRFLI
ncbi:MAG: hypothetical protein J6W52_09935 [Bacteroidaceae bacterium]|nr:hypothetical protein [Bacteroidaceae bacterium]